VRPLYLMLVLDMLIKEDAKVVGCDAFVLRCLDSISIVSSLCLVYISLHAPLRPRPCPALQTPTSALQTARSPRQIQKMPRA
jgi:hypothetical protein